MTKQVFAGICSIALLSITATTSTSTSTSTTIATATEYGVDVSFPMQHATVSTNYPWLTDPEDDNSIIIQPLGDRQSFYKDFIDGCVDRFGDKGARCLQNEHDRISMTLRQPQSMQNYTLTGYQKIKAPPDVWKLIKNFWDNNKGQRRQHEKWGVGNTYTNNWESPTEMVSVEDSGLRGGGRALKDKIWEAARSTISEWTGGQELTPCSLYGIRVYGEGSILAPHVDRLPLVSSAIINVAQDVDEPWPLEVIGRDGKAVNVTMEPGDMVLYESHSTIHGRPFPLKGRYYANIFVHFEPTGHTLRHHDHKTNIENEDVNEKYRQSLLQGTGGHENLEQQEDRGGLPSYILAGSKEDTRWRQQHPTPPSSVPNTAGQSYTTGSTVAHKAAMVGDAETLKEECDSKKHLISAKDENGWQPIHEGARGGHVEILRYLIENGADVNAQTTPLRKDGGASRNGGGGGGTALYYAKQAGYDADHPVITLLESLGAVEIGPDL